MDAFIPLRSLELTEDEVRAVLARYGRRRRRRFAVPALAFAAAAVVAVAVPQSRAELADALRAALHGGALPGDVAPAESLPEWLRQVRFAPLGEPRVIAEAEGARMLVFRQESGSLCFDFGSVGICDWSEDDLFDDGPVALFGPVAPADGRFRLWGLTLATVDYVEVRFADRATVSVRPRGAFGVVLEPDSEPTELVAYGADGSVLATVDLAERWKHRPAL